MSKTEPGGEDEVQYVDAEPIGPGESPLQPRESAQSRTYYYRGSTGGVPCCSGCGCFAVALLLLVFANLGSVLSTLVVVVAAIWIGGALLRMLGVNRNSAAYVFLMVPVFLVLANLIAKFIRGTYPYTWREAAIGTLAIYAFLLVATTLATRSRR